MASGPDGTAGGLQTEPLCVIRFGLLAGRLGALVVRPASAMTVGCRQGRADPRRVRPQTHEPGHPAASAAGALALENGMDARGPVGSAGLLVHGRDPLRQLSAPHCAGARGASAARA